jgi:hypothetical protein
MYSVMNVLVSKNKLYFKIFFMLNLKLLTIYYEKEN